MGKKKKILWEGILGIGIFLIGLAAGIVWDREGTDRYSNQTIENLALLDVRTGEVIPFAKQEIGERLLLKNAEGRILFMGEKNEAGQYLTGSLLVGDELIEQNMAVQGQPCQRECYDLALVNQRNGREYPISEYTTLLQIEDAGIFFSHHTVETSEGKGAFRLELIIFSCGLGKKSIKSM